jgi:flagellar capping protein FliD
MKKILLSCLVLCSISFSSCEKDNSISSTTTKDKKDVPTPTASFTVTARDANGTTITLEEGVPVTARTVIIRYTGSATDYKAVFPGDASRTYIPNPSTPPATAQSGLTFASDSLSHTYAAAGTYPITVVATNVGDKGREIKRSVVTKTITLR